MIDQDHDSNSTGLGLFLRLGGVFLPFVAAGAVEAGLRRTHAVTGAPAAILRVFGFVWGWPMSGYARAPLWFGLIGIVSVVFLAALAARHDRRGFIAVLVWTLFWGWVLAAADLIFGE